MDMRELQAEFDHQQSELLFGNKEKNFQMLQMHQKNAMNTVVVQKLEATKYILDCYKHMLDKPDEHFLKAMKHAYNEKFRSLELNMSLYT